MIFHPTFVSNLTVRESDNNTTSLHNIYFNVLNVMKKLIICNDFLIESKFCPNIKNTEHGKHFNSNKSSTVEHIKTSTCPLKILIDPVPITRLTVTAPGIFWYVYKSYDIVSLTRDRIECTIFWCILFTYDLNVDLHVLEETYQYPRTLNTWPWFWVGLSFWVGPFINTHYRREKSKILE